MHLILRKGYYKSKYKFITCRIDWKTLVDNSKHRDRINACKIKSSISGERMLFDETVPDCLFYLSNDFREQILETVTKNCNHAFIKMCKTFPKFKGKVSIMGHSLGSVIMYDMLSKQKPENFTTDNGAE